MPADHHTRADASQRLEAADAGKQRPATPEIVAVASSLLRPLAAIEQISSALATVSTPAEVACVTVQTALTALGATTGALRLLEAEGRDLAWVPVPDHLPPLLPASYRPVPDTADPMSEALHTAQMVIVESPDECADRFPAFRARAAGKGVLAGIAVPLLVHEHVLGILSFTFSQPRRFSAEEREFIHVVGALTAQAVERTRLHAAEQRRAARLMALHQIAAGLSAVRTPEEVAGVVMQVAAKELGANLGSLRILSGDGTKLTWLPAPGYQPGPTVNFQSNSLDERLPWTDAVRTGTMVTYETAEDGRNTYPELSPFSLQIGIHASCALPLLVNGRPVGALSLNFPEPHRFSPDEADFMQVIASLTAQALDRSRLYVAERERAQAAEDLAQLRSDFLASVSHELRTPLASVVGYGELLEARWHELGESRKREYLRRIVRAAGRQVALVEDLLLASVSDLGALPVHRHDMLVVATARQAAQEVRGSYPDQAIVLDGPDDLHAHADPARVVQVLANLLDNAAKHSPAGSEILLRWAREHSRVAVRVTDRGPGIPEAGRDRLFARFGRLPDKTVRAGRVGTGLGLYLGRSLAKAMGGSLELEASSPLGTTFMLALPLAQA